MPKFRFQRLLEIKEKLMEHKQRELESTVGEAKSLADEALALAKKITGHYDEMGARCITGEEFSLLMGSVAYLDGRRAEVTREKEKKDARIGVLRMELMALVIELKMLEKLKVKDLRAARKALGRKEQKAMDDLAGRPDAPKGL